MILTKLRPYQVTASKMAISALKSGGGFLLIPEQRTGKCLVTLDTVDKIKPNWLIVVCPKVAMPVWEKEIKQHLKVDWPLEITLINYEQMVAHRKFWYKAVKKVEGSLIVADEAHRLKTRGSSRSGVIRHIAKYCDYRLALTGTPVAEGMHDAWALFDFVDPEILGKYDDTVNKKTKEVTAEGFNSRYLVWGGFKNKQIVGYKNQDQFREILAEHSYRITLRAARKQGGGKSSMIKYSKTFVDLSERTWLMYREIEKTLQTIVNGKKVKAKNVLGVVMKMQQITGGFLKDEEGEIHRVGMEKLEALHTLVRSMQSRQKFIVICRFVPELEAAQSYLRKLNYTVAMVRGGMPFDGEFKTDAIVMQIQSGEAVDMSKADRIFFYSTDYSAIHFEQSRFRILSYNKHFGHYQFLLAKGTIDELIYEALTDKVNLAKLVIDRYRR